MTVLRFERVYALPPEIVWDALVDPDLVSGWLAEADIEPRIDGRYDLDWRHLDPVQTTTGQILELIEPRLLVVDTDNVGVTTFELEPGDERTTRLTATVDAIAELPFTPMISATWRISLEQLDELLHARPVNWATWRQGRSERWHELLEEQHRRI